MNQFPAFAENVLNMIIQKYEPDEEAECIFERKKVKKDSHEGTAKIEEGEFRPDESAPELHQHMQHHDIPAVNPVVAQIALADLEMKQTKANIIKARKLRPLPESQTTLVKTPPPPPIYNTKVSK